MATASDYRIGLLMASTVSVALLVGAAVGRWPYGYYTLLRLIVCGTVIYLAFIASEAKSRGWAITFVLLALLFNPVFIVRMHRADWRLFDIAAAIVIATAAALFRRK